MSHASHSSAFSCRLLLLCFFLASIAASGCATHSVETAKSPGIALATEGPPLFISGEYAGMRLSGTMDRTVMVGYGVVSVAAEQPGTSFLCESTIDAPPTEKGRVRGLLECTGGRKLLFSLRNIGPDQGVGIGKETEDGELMTLFYHASREEAERRFPEVKADIVHARSGKK